MPHIVNAAMLAPAARLTLNRRQFIWLPDRQRRLQLVIVVRHVHCALVFTRASRRASAFTSFLLAAFLRAMIIDAIYSWQSADDAAA